jgi:hypothetical protein
MTYGVLNWLHRQQAHIGVKGRVKDAVTGQPLSNTVIHVKNVTAERNDDILHDVTSGELSRLDVSKTEELVRQNVS